MTTLSWTRSINPGGWLETHSTNDLTSQRPQGSFQVERHIGDTAHYDYGVMSGKPYQLVVAEDWAPGTSVKTIREEGAHIWRYAKSYATLEEAQAAAQELA